MFDPDAYLAGDAPFDPDAYLSGFNPDEYLKQEPRPDANAFLNLAGGFLGGIGGAAQAAKGAFGDFIGDEEMVANAKAAREQIAREIEKTKPNIESDLGKAAYGGVQSFVQNIPALAVGAITRSPAAAMSVMLPQVGAEAYGKYRDRGGTPGEAALGATGETLVEGATEMIPMGTLLKRFGKEALLPLFTKIALQEGVGEQAATLAQDAIDTAIANPNKTWAQYWAERPKAALDTAIATGVQVGLTGVGGVGVSRLTPKGPDTADTVGKSLDAIDEANKQRELTQGEGTLYAGTDGTITPDLPTKVQETPEQLDLIRTELQKNLEEQATRDVEPQQRELFTEEGMVPERQLDAPLDPASKSREEILALNKSARDLHSKYMELAKEAEAAGRQGLADTYKKMAGDELAKLDYTVKDESVQPVAAQAGETPPGFWINFGPGRSKVVDLPGQDPLVLSNRRFNVERLTSYNPKTGQFDGRELLRILKETLTDLPSSLPFKEIYTELLGNLEQMVNGGTKFALDIDLDTGAPRMLSVDRTRPANKGHPAQYDPNTDTVWFGLSGQFEGTAVHEVAHALSSRALHVLDGKKAGKPELKGGFYTLSDKNSRTRRLYALFNEAKKQFNNGQYGFQDIHEFIAEAWSNPEFQADLAMIEIPVDGKKVSGLHAFVKSIMRAFGFSEAQVNDTRVTNAFSEAMHISSELMQDYAKNKQSWDLEYKRQFPVDTPGIGQAINAMTGGAVAATKAAQSNIKIKDPEVAKGDLVKKITGVNYIPTDPEVTPQLIEKIAKEKDGSGVWALTPGANMRAELANSTLVKTVFRFMDNAFKRADKFSREVVQPVEKTISKLLRSEKGNILHDVLVRELRNGRDYTREELLSAGVSEDVIMAHLEFRTMMQEALEKQNMILRDKGMKPVTAVDAYLSARWSGPWRANIKDADGKIVFQIAEQTKGMAKKAMEHLKAKHPDLKYEDIAYRKGFEKSDGLEAGYLDMLELLDPSDPRVAALKSVYEQYVLGKTEDVADQEKHFLRKSGVGGYAGDRPWSKHDTKDTFVQQFLYAKNAAKWAESQRAVEGTKKLLNDPTLQDSQKNNIQYSKEYIKNQLGFGTEDLWNNIDNSVAKLFRTSPANLQNYMGAAKTLFYLKELGMNLPFTVVQFLQPAITGPALHAKLSAEGFKHNPVMSTFHAISGGLADASYHYNRLLGNIAGVKASEALMTKLELEAAKYMEDNGVINITPMSDIKRNLRPQGVKAISAPFELTISIPETISRSMAFMGVVNHLRQSGKFDTKTREGRLALFQAAEEATGFHMTDYRSQERALQFERMGLTGDAVATLRSYMLNNLAQGVKYSKMARDGNPMPLIYFMSMQAMAGGLAGLWFLDDLDELIENLKKLLPDDQYNKIKDFSIKTWMLENLGEGATYGLASKATGSNIHTRMNQSNIIPVWPFEQPDPMKTLENLAPFGGAVADVANLGLTTASPSSTPQDMWSAAHKAAPAGLRGPMEGMEPFSTRLGPDEILTRRPSDLSKGDYTRTDTEQTYRNLGLRSTKEQIFKDKDWNLSKVERELQDRLATNSKKAKEFLTSGNMEQALERVLKYDMLGGDVEALLNSMTKTQIDRLTTEVQRRAMSATTKPGILKLQRYLNAHEIPTTSPTPSSPQVPQRPVAPQRSMAPTAPKMEVTSLGYNYPKDVDLNVLASLEKQYGLPHGMLESVMYQESKGRAHATSHKGAMGHFQFMPATAKELGVKNPRDFRQAAEGAAKHLKRDLDRFGDLTLALAAYNAGPANVAKHKGIPPFKETQEYVRKITERMKQHAGN
jgi:hypothetical protein